MNHRKVRIYSLVVLVAGVFAESTTATPAEAKVRNDGFCANTCSAIEYCDGVKGSTCTIETCYDNMNTEYPYVIRCVRPE